MLKGLQLDEALTSFRGSAIFLTKRLQGKTLAQKGTLAPENYVMCPQESCILPLFLSLHSVPVHNVVRLWRRL